MKPFQNPNDSGAPTRGRPTGATSSRALAAPIRPMDAQDYAMQSWAPSTVRAYRGAWDAWVRWCGAQRTAPLPASPRALERYVTELANAGHAPRSIDVYLSGIRHAHRLSGLASPTDDAGLRRVIVGIRRVKGVAPRRKTALRLEQLGLVVNACGDDLAGLRDKALLTIGWAAALRRSELVALTVDDVEIDEDGMVLTIRRGKTDQEGMGRRVGVPYARVEGNPCPVSLLAEWLAAARITHGPLFRWVHVGSTTVGKAALTGGSVLVILRRRLEAAGLELAGDWGAHSLRAGLVTEAARRGADVFAIQAQTGHKSLAVLGSYVRESDLFSKNAATLAGL